MCDGIDMIGEHVGGVSLRDFQVIQLPASPTGVNIDQFDHNVFDPAVDLHIVHARFREDEGEDSDDVTIGTAFYKAGIAWIQPDLSAHTTTTTVAHEIGHSLGYVLPNAPQLVEPDYGHCEDTSCIMASDATEDPPYRHLAFADRRNSRIIQRLVRGSRSISDFCSPCKTDMRQTGERNTEEMRRLRQLNGRII